MDQMVFLANKREDYENSQAGLDDLFDRLLRIGGKQVVACYEEDLDLLLLEGTIAEFTDLQIEAGRPCRCHENVWEVRNAEVWTGWGLSDDGLWRQHSWAKRGATLIETTTPRLVYWGVRIDQL